jgi:hypothetical protein
MKKRFHCKIEDLPTIARFLLSSYLKDLDDFHNYSPVFTIEYLSPIEVKITICEELISSSVVIKELKTVTIQLYAKSKNLRIKLNALEGYLKLTASELDVTVEDVGLRSVRTNISNGNTEGLILNVQKVLAAVVRNQAVLEAKGMKPELIDEIKNQAQEIKLLNVRQNDLISDRNRMTKLNVELFNDLWDGLQPILKTATAIYRGVDNVKLKDYTISQLLKRINNVGGTKKTSEAEVSE